MDNAESIKLQAQSLAIPIQFPEQVDEFFVEMKPGYFTVPEYQKLYKTMNEIYNRNGEFSAVDLGVELIDWEDGEQIIGELNELYTKPSDLKATVKVLEKEEQKRTIRRAANDILGSLGDNEIDHKSYAVQKITEAATEHDSKFFRTLTDVLGSSLGEMAKRKDNISDTVIPCGFEALNAYLHGWRPGELVILAARPSMGKSALMNTFCRKVAQREKHVAIFSLEMPDTQIADRYIIEQGGINGEDFQKTPMTAETYKQGEQAIGQIYESYSDYIHVQDKAGITTDEICTYARALKGRVGALPFIAVDYLQLIQPPADTGSYHLAKVIGDMVRQLRNLGRELDATVILLSQLNRSIESRDNKRPMMSDLRDSGNIEEHADKVVFLYREEYYNPQKAEKLKLNKTCEVLVRKNRNGPVGKCFLYYNPAKMLFKDIPLTQQKELLRRVDHD